MQPESIFTTALSPTWFAAHAAGRHLQGTHVSTALEHCAMCGALIEPGDHCNTFKPGATFTDYRALAVSDGERVCVGCTAVWEKLFMQRLANVVITRKAFFPFASNQDRSYFLVNPPEPPFIMQSSDAQMQHLLWKGRLSLSRDLYFLRFGEKNYPIRRPALMAAHQTYPRLIERLTALAVADLAAKQQAEGKPSAARGRRPSKPPVVRLFVSLGREMGDPDYGRLTPRVESLLAAHPEVDAEIRPYLALNTGELWALGVLLRTSEIPTKPPAALDLSRL